MQIDDAIRTQIPTTRPSCDDSFRSEGEASSISISCFDKLTQIRFSTARSIESNESFQVQSTEKTRLFFDEAIKRTSDRIAKNPNSNLRYRKENERLVRRKQTLELIQRILQEGQFLGAMGWGSFCNFKTNVGDGSSEVDSIYLKVGGEIKCLQLDSCLEAQQLNWVVNDTSSIGLNQSQNYFSIYGRLFTSDCNWQEGSKPLALYRKRKFDVQKTLLSLPSSFVVPYKPVLPPVYAHPSSGSTARVTTLPFSSNCEVANGLESFKECYNKLKDTVHSQNKDRFEMVEKKLFPSEREFESHRRDMENAFYTPQRVVANGIRWEMPGNGGAVVIGKDSSQNGWDTIDQWVDMTVKGGCDPFEGAGENQAVYLQSGVMPMDQVTDPDVARVMLNMVLINAASGYSIAKYDEEIYISPEVAKKLFESLQKNYEHIEVKMNAYSYSWVVEAANGTEYAADYTKLAEKLMKQLHGWTIYANQKGICCPLCNKKCEVKERKFSAISYKDVGLTGQPPSFDLASIITFNQNGDLQLDSVYKALKNPLSSIAEKIEEFDLEGLNLHQTVLDKYQANSKFKIAMLMEQIMTVLDTLDTYAKSEQDSKLGSLLTPEINNLKTILLVLTRELVNNPDIPDSVTNDNWYTPEIVQTNYKARFAIAVTVNSALDVLGSLGESLLPIAQDKLFSKARLNPDIKDEKTYLRKYRRLNADPKVEPIDVTLSLGKRLTRVLSPVLLNMVAGKLGVGKSQFLNVSFDDASFTTINSQKVFKLDNIEKAESNFDVKGSPPEEKLLVTITPDGLKKLTQEFSLVVPSAEKEEDPEDGAKLVGCSCCLGRGLTQGAIEGVSRGVKGVDSNVIVLDSIGYADIKGMATISHESVTGRVFFNHALTLVNLCNPGWEQVYTFICDQKKLGKKDYEMIEALNSEFGGKFTNVLVQQLVYATHVLVNNHQEMIAISEENLQYIIESIGGDSRVIKGFNAREKHPEISKLLSDFDDSSERKQLSPLKVRQEVDIFDGELDKSFVQEVLDISKIPIGQKEIFKRKLQEMGLQGKIDRAKAHLKVGDKWYELQITDGHNCYYKEVTADTKSTAGVESN